MKTNAIIRIIVFSLAIIVLSTILLSVLDQNYYIADGKIQSYEMAGPVPTESVREVNQHDISTQIQNIEIEWVAGSITIHRSDSLSNIHVSETCPAESEHKMVVKQSGQTLKIQFSDETIKLSSFGINVDVSKDLVITVPRNWNCNNLEIETASAEVLIDGMTIHEFDFDGASGVCNITNCDIQEMDIDTASGNVGFSGTLETLDCDAASADCKIEVTNIPRSVKLDAMSGDLELILPPDAGFTCNLDSMSGSFNSDFEFRTISETYIHGDGSCKINVSALSGDVSILKGLTAVHTGATYCTDANCNDPSHDHSGICKDENCTDAAHGHNNHH